MTERPIVLRTRGSQHGFIRRMMSPGDVGELLKPFVFLDFIHGTLPKRAGFGWHPHSGIATLTYSLNSDTEYEDTVGQKGIVQATGLEWMRAGGGTWHQGFAHPLTPVTTAFQLWVALPPQLENGEPEGLYVPPDDVPQVGNVRVLLGSYGGAHNPIPAPSPMTYLDVVVAAGERFVITPDASHDVAWAMVYEGHAHAGSDVFAGDLVVWQEGHDAIAVEAKSAVRMLVGTAQKHQHPLVLGSHSVHTSEAGLLRGEQRIREVHRLLREQRRT